MNTEYATMKMFIIVVLHIVALFIYMWKVNLE